MRLKHTPIFHSPHGWQRSCCWIVTSLLLLGLIACGGGGGDKPQPALFFSVTPVAGANGTISPATPQSVEENTTTSFTITPDEGYQIDAVTGCGGTLVGSSYTTAAVTADCTVTASFKPVPVPTFMVTPVAGPNGLINPATPQSVAQNSNRTFYLKPDKGYFIDEVIGCPGSRGKVQDNNSHTYNVFRPTADCTLNVTFRAIPPPANVQVTAGDTYIVVNWEPFVGDGKYNTNIYYTTEAGHAAEIPGGYSYEGVWTQKREVGQPPYVIRGLTNGIPHYVIVTAIMDGNEGPGSDELTATPTEPSPSPRRALNDTGFDWCVNYDLEYSCSPWSSREHVFPCSQEGFVGQDGDFGRDYLARTGQLVKKGGGAAGFDYSQVCNSGEIAGQGSCPETPLLGSNENEWGCTKDNLTGLIWEVKTTSGLRNFKNQYWWYDPNPVTNGGSPDSGWEPVQPTCDNIPEICSTYDYVQAVNREGLCGAKDWRMPTRRELLSISNWGIFNNGAINEAIDLEYFPNTPGGDYWSSSTTARSRYSAWAIRDTAKPLKKNLRSYVRLVRQSQ